VDERAPLLEWSVSLGAHQAGKRYVVVALAVAVFLIGIIMLGSLPLALIGSGVVLASTLELFMPIWYRLDNHGAQARTGFALTRIEWSEVKRTWEDELGVYLSPLEQPSRLDRFRGVYLRFASNREAVLVKIGDQLGNDVGTVATGSDTGGENESGGSGGDHD
jgi:hypothetical protein